MAHLLSSRPLLYSQWALLPPAPGVYIYKDKNKEIIYVGKAKNLKNRVRSYFQPPIKLGIKTAVMVAQIQTLQYIEVNSEIEALLLESKLIKRFKPKYNIAAKDDKSPYYIHIIKGKYPKPIVNHEPVNSLAGPFLNRYTASTILRQFRRIAPFCTALHPERPCLYTHIGLCDPDLKHYQKNIKKLKKLLQGQFASVSRELVNQMQLTSKHQNFEQAAILRDKIKNLDYLLHKPISADEYIVNPNLTEDKRQEALSALELAFGLQSLERIEMYDIANLSGTAATGAMTVAINGQITPRQYRHFTIHQNQPNDVEMMREMLTRRLKRDDWPRPDLIVLDGGMAQLSIVSSITPLPPLKLRGGGRQDEGDTIPVFGLAKQEEVIFDVHGNEIRLERNNPGLQLLQLLRDEAHRFSRRLHHKHRSGTIKST